MRGEAPIGVIAIAEELVSLSVAAPGLDYWVIIGGDIEGEVKMDSLNIEETGDGITRARATVVNPDTEIAEGKTFQVIWRGEVVFGGIVRTLTINSDQSEAAIVYQIEADGWDSILARHTVTATYANKTTGFILRDAIGTSDCDLDGVVPDVIDDGPNMIQVKADHVRMVDFVRDVGSAGGGLAFIDAYKRIQFRPTSKDYADYVITNADCEKIVHMGDIDNYRNRQIVKVTGLDGVTTVTETRDNLGEQAARALDEGGSGIYEDYEEVKHPTSSVVGDLSILGQTVGYLELRTYASSARRVTVTMREPAPKLGQLTTLNLPGFTISGTFFVMRKTWRDVGGQFLFDLEFWESSFQQRALESLLRIVGAAKSSVSISSEVFPNVQLFSVVGATTWTVPVGVTSAQFTVEGGSGGGGGGRWGWSSISGAFWVGNGGKGGNSGKAVTIVAVVAGQVYDLVIGAGGTKGANGAAPDIHGLGMTDGTNGGAGALSSAKLAALVIAQGNGGGGGVGKTVSGGGTAGAAGSGVGDAVSVGGGTVGGAGGTQTVQPKVGLAGLVEVRW